MKRRYIATEPHVSDEPVCDSDRAIYFADEVDQRIAELEGEVERLEAERVPDEIIRFLLMRCANTISHTLSVLEKREEALAILEKRDKG